MTVSDLPQVVMLENLIFSDPWPEDAFLEQTSGDNWTALVVESDSRIIGYGCYFWAGTKSHLTNMAVHPDYRRKSVAKRLLTDILRVVRKSGCDLMTLEVRAGNADAIAFYKAFDFIELYRRPNYYRRPVEEALVMVRYITDDEEEN